MYRDITVTHTVVAWAIPGASSGNDYLMDIVSRVIGSGKGSRLYKKLVDELQLVTDLEAFDYDLADYGIFFIYFQPKDPSDVEKIIHTIQHELRILSETLVSEAECTRAIKKVEVDHLALLESNQKQAYEIGKYFLAIGDEQFLYTYTDTPKDHLAYQIRDFVKAYLRPILMYKATMLPLAEKDRSYWLELQEVSDQEDARILGTRARTALIEEGKCVSSIKIAAPKPFIFAKSHSITLSNGLKILYSVQDHLPKIDIILDFEAKQQYDPKGKEGLSSFVGALLLEGTKNYSAEALIDTLESYGMTIQTSAGLITLSMLAVDLPKGLELLNEILTHATFKPENIEKVRAQMLADLNEFWDSPSDFAVQLVRQEIYKDNPLSENVLGTVEGVKNITRDDIINFYRTFYSPHGARLALVGDIAGYDIKVLLEKVFASWQGPLVEELKYPQIEPVKKHKVNYPILRDQTVLCYAGLSVTRQDPDYDKLLLFDQIFGGGVLGSMASRLFDLREQSGLFYTIRGSLTSGVDKHKGLVVVKTIVSNDRLAEAEKAIEHVINTAIDTVTNEEFESAQQVLVNSLVDNFASYYKIAATLLFKDKFGLPEDYFDKRASQLSKITKQEMQAVVKKYLNTDKFVIVRIGRV